MCNQDAGKKIVRKCKHNWYQWSAPHEATKYTDGFLWTYWPDL